MNGTREITLPSGVTATIRKGKGRDQRNAQRKCEDLRNDLPYALIAELITIGGKPVLFEDVLDMDLDDVQALQEAVFAGKTSSSSPPGI